MKNACNDLKGILWIRLFTKMSLSTLNHVVSWLLPKELASFPNHGCFQKGW